MKYIFALMIIGLSTITMTGMGYRVNRLAERADQAIQERGRVQETTHKPASKPQKTLAATNQQTGRMKAQTAHSEVRRLRRKW